MSVALSGLEGVLAGYRNSVTARQRYRLWHVESLLNQAADLLDRCLRDRAEYRALQQSQHAYEMDKKADQLELDRQQSIQTDPGFSAERVRAENIQQRRILFGEAYHAAHAKLELAESIVGSSTVAGLSFFVERTKIDMESDLNGIEATYADAVKSREQLAAARQAALIAYLQARKLSKDAFFKVAGTETTIYEERLRALERRIVDDFKDAYDRIEIARDGMEKIYGYRDVATFPSNDPSVDGFSQIDAALLWLRSAIRWLVAFGQLDQAWTAVFSVRDLVKQGSDTLWESQIIEGGTEAKFFFELPAETFGSHTYARLRGMVMFAHFDESASTLSHMPMTAVIKLPRAAVSFQVSENDPEGEPQSITLDQSSVPPCYFGRIERPDAMRLPEMAGTVSLMNASPIQQTGSRWELRLAAPKGHTFKYLRDVTIELNMLGQPRRVPQ